jgi:hypothetical protein
MMRRVHGDDLAEGCDGEQGLDGMECERRGRRHGLVKEVCVVFVLMLKHPRLLEQLQHAGLEYY